MSNEMEIVDKLVSLIISGRYNAHDKIPSENEIADQYKLRGYNFKKEGLFDA
ncbi:MAG: GntR family transcriptional regulator [Desulfosporosinus sp.]|nr:GntR family transcriptional regulator [Desulfosporosinus sp.]